MHVLCTAIALFTTSGSLLIRERQLEFLAQSSAAGCFTQLSTVCTSIHSNTEFLRFGLPPLVTEDTRCGAGCAAGNNLLRGESEHICKAEDLNPLLVSPKCVEMMKWTEYNVLLAKQQSGD